jgi:signal transduction histidine kinase
MILKVSSVMALVSFSVTGRDFGPGEDVSLPLLTNVAQVRSLTASEAGRGYPVSLRAVVTYFNPVRRGDLILQDETAGIFVGSNLPGESFASGFFVEPGQIVELKGKSYPGKFAPVILADAVEIMDRGRLPDPIPLSYDKLATGQFDCQYIEVEGIVRSAFVNHEMVPERLILETASGGGRIVAHVLDHSSFPFKTLEDATVRIRGVCMHLFNEQRQFFNLRVVVSKIADVVVEKRPAAEPFATAPRPINSLMQFTPEGSSGHRVKVVGTVLHQEPGEALFIRDATQALQVRTKQNTAARPGEEVEVLGFAAMGDYTPIMEDAIFRKTGESGAPQAQPLSAPEALGGRFNADLIRVTARLLDRMKLSDKDTFVLQSGDLIFHAQLNRALSKEEQFVLEKGSLLEATGICLVELGRKERLALKPEGFRLLIRSFTDLRVVERPPWWTNSRKLRFVAAGVSTVMGVLLLGLILSRQRLKEQKSRQAAAEAQFSAVLAERGRIAREIHDTLEQGFTGIMLQLDAAAAKLVEAPETTGRYLEMARNMVRYSRAEVRESIWDLRSPILQKNDLPTAFLELARQFTINRQVEVEVDVRGETQRLPIVLETHLLRIGQEAMTNAAKHARAAKIQVRLRFNAGEVNLEIEDDGCGFDLESISRTNGHFGLCGMQERANKMGALLEIQSRVNEGTRVLVKLPTRPEHGASRVLEARCFEREA